jgi:GNAT superfamily N-acetyltransferase
MSTAALDFHRLSGIADLHFPAWLDAISTGFPPDEQMLPSFFFDALGMERFRFYATLDQSQALVAILMYQLRPHNDTCYLWYIWVADHLRSQGIGSQVFGFMVGQAREELPNLRAVVWEIERTDVSPSRQERQDAERRMAFYRRQGGLVATNVVYHQSCGRADQLPKLMHLCLLPVQPLSEQESLAILRDVFGDSMEPVDRLVLA